MNSLISNPPYNMKWIPPEHASTQRRFRACELPPKSNANYAFILTGLEDNDRCVFILPCSILQGGLKEEQKIRQYLVEKNYIEAVILCPDNMFEATSISTCILVLDKNKQATTIEMLDMRQKYKEEVRIQNGQYGSSAHTNRAYEKKFKIFTDDIMKDAMECIEKRKSIPEYCKPVEMEDVKRDNYTLLASHYMEFVEHESIHRDFKDIVNDINRITMEKNACKLTINETIARNFGFDIELYKQDQQDAGLNDLLQKLGAEKLEKQNYFTASKNKNEIKFENNSKEIISSILIMILNTWKQHIYYLNTEENRLLTELRDALLPDLMSGKIEV